MNYKKESFFFFCGLFLKKNWLPNVKQTCGKKKVSKKSKQNPEQNLATKAMPFREQAWMCDGEQHEEGEKARGVYQKTPGCVDGL